jgi:hypothetical protein
MRLGTNPVTSPHIPSHGSQSLPVTSTPVPRQVIRSQGRCAGDFYLYTVLYVEQLTLERLERRQGNLLDFDGAQLTACEA